MIGGNRKMQRWSLAVAMATIVCGALSALDMVDARSVPPPPVRRIHHPRDVSMTVIPRSTGSQSRNNRKRSSFPEDELLSSDALRISLEVELPDRPRHHGQGLSADRSIETVHLHLSPTEHLLHPQAKMTTFSVDGSVLSSEPLFRDDFRVYDGEVIIGRPESDRRLTQDQAGGIWYPPGSERSRGVRGRTSVMVHEHGHQPVFEGMFSVDGQVYHILTKENYDRHRKHGEPVVVGGTDDQRMVIFLEGDRDSSDDDGVEQQTSQHAGCSHDRLAFNTNTTINPILRPRPKINPYSPRRPSIGSWSPTGLISKWDLPFLNRPMDDPFESTPSRRHEKRDDISGTYGGSNYIDTIGQTAGCPKEQRVVYMGVAADCNYVSQYGDAQKTRTQILSNWNQISALYRSTFNISIGIVELEVVDGTCPSSAPSDKPWNTACNSQTTLNDRLSIFSQWRGRQTSSQAGLWHLMSACPTDTEVGVAWLGTLCQTDVSGTPGNYVSGTGVSTAAKIEWSLVAHEIGHNFGAIHDCTSGCSLTGSCCPLTTQTCSADGQFIMNPTTSTTEVAFSPCTLGAVCGNIQTQKLSTSCLVNPGSQRAISLQACGNGIVEEGEDCDPGGNSTSSCCDSATCKFINGAVCDPSSHSCCTSSCSFAPSTQMCRAAVDAKCDIPEYCTGSAGTCPEDKTEANGKSCGSNGLACASGRCTSLDQQCRNVGASMNLSKACNSKGDKSCVVTCQSPESSNQCLVLQTPLIDGSPCGYGGRCGNGTCQSGSVGDTISSWYRQNLQISIPITIAVGILGLAILISIFRCLFCGGCCGAGRKKPKKAKVLRGGGGSANTLQRASQDPRQSMASVPIMRQSGSGYDSSFPPAPAAVSDGRTGARRSDSWDGYGTQSSYGGYQMGTQGPSQAYTGGPSVPYQQVYQPAYGGQQVYQPPFGQPAYGGHQAAQPPPPPRHPSHQY